MQRLVITNYIALTEEDQRTKLDFPSQFCVSGYGTSQNVLLASVLAVLISSNLENTKLLGPVLQKISVALGSIWHLINV
jgi:hypothetical protein